MTFTDDERSFLVEARLARIATASSKGVPDVAPVTFEVAENEIRITGMDITKTRKYHNIRATGMASVVVDDLASTDPWQPRGVKVTGVARIVGAGAESSITISPETLWSWGINGDAETHFGPIEKRNVAPTA